MTDSDKIKTLPLPFLERMKEMLGDDYDAFLKSYENPRTYGLRVNTAKLSCQEFEALSPFKLQPIPWISNGYFYNEESRPARCPYYQAGLYYLQEPSAMTPASRLPIEPGDFVLDLCAAPGGKATALGAALNDTGFLLATDISTSRARALLRNLELFGIKNMLVTDEKPAKLAQRFPSFFNKILLDAPCSGEGMFRKEEALARDWTPEKSAELSDIQKDLVLKAADMLRPGGMLLYSTCTFAPGEDEGQIAAFLARHPEFTLCDLSGCGFGQPGEANRAGNDPLQAEYCRRIWPCDGGEGHFMAKLQKAADAPAVELPRGKNGKGKGGKTPRVDAKALQAWQSFAKELFPTLAGQPIAVVGDGFLLEPPALLPAAKLHVLRAGVPAGRAAKGRFEPAHALFMAYGAQCTNCEKLTLADPRTAAWLRGEEIEAQTAQNGWCAVLVDGFPLGGGKASGGRIKNHYPKALRNLK